MTKLTKKVRHTAHKASTQRAHRKVSRLHKKAAFDTMLSPEFKPEHRSTRQEIIAGVTGGVLLLVFVLVLLIVGIPSIGSFTSSGDDSSSTTATAPGKKSVVAEQTYLQLTLKNWRFSEGGKDYRAYPGFRYVVLNVELKHKYTVPTWLAPSLQSYVVDQAGQQYQLTPDDEITDPLAAKQYEPGAVATGGLAYEVPDSATNLQWCYDLGRGSAKTAPLCITLQ